VLHLSSQEGRRQSSGKKQYSSQPSILGTEGSRNLAREKKFLTKGFHRLVGSVFQIFSAKGAIDN